VDAAVAGLTSMIEPLVIAFLGIIIGGIVVALFLPILQITQLIQH
jgi:type IV pilus assembly protein PilC